jgi:hypothetical protein
VNVNLQSDPQGVKRPVTHRQSIMPTGGITMEVATTTAIETTLKGANETLDELESLTDVQLALIGGGQGLFVMD